MAEGEKVKGLVGYNLEWSALVLLKLLKSKYDYKSLSKFSGLPISTLSRYLKGRTVPRRRRARQLLKTLLPLANPKELVEERIRLGEEGELDCNSILFDPWMLSLLSTHVANAFAGRKVTCIVAGDEDSVPLATTIAVALGKKFTIASKKPAWKAEEAVVNVVYNPKRGKREAIWMPKSVLLRRESLLIVFASLLDEEYANMVISSIQKGKARMTGLFAVAAEKGCWEKINLPPAAKKENLLTV